MSAKILILCLQLVPLAIWGWRRATHGWRADFTHLPGIKTQQIQHRGATAEVREQCSKIGWPIEALMQFKLERSWLFELSPQPAIRFSGELEIGVPLFDEKFFIGLESQRFARALAGNSALRQHLSLLRTLLARHQAKLVRVASEGDELAVHANVRWTHDRPALYRGLLVWMQGLGALLEARSSDVAARRSASAPPGHGPLSA